MLFLAALQNPKNVKPRITNGNEGIMRSMKNANMIWVSLRRMAYERRFSHVYRTGNRGGPTGSGQAGAGKSRSSKAPRVCTHPRISSTRNYTHNCYLTLSLTSSQSARAGNSPLVRKVIEEYNLDVTLPEKSRKQQKSDVASNFETLLHVAASSCDEDLISFLLERGRVSP